MDTTGRPSYVFQFFCAPGTPVEQNRPQGQLQLLTQPASAEPALRRGRTSRSRRRRSRTITPEPRCRRPSIAGHAEELHAPRLQDKHCLGTSGPIPGHKDCQEVFPLPRAQQSTGLGASSASAALATTGFLKNPPQQQQQKTC